MALRRSRYADQASQTGINDNKDCGFVSYAKSVGHFTLNCFYCTDTFPIWSWINFVTHVEKQHQYAESIYQYNDIHIEDLSDDNISQTVSEGETMDDENSVSKIELLKVRKKSVDKMSMDDSKIKMEYFEAEDECLQETTLNDSIEMSNSSQTEAELEEMTPQNFERASTSGSSTAQLSTVKKETAKTHISSTSQLPPLTMDLKKKFQEAGILQAQQYFIYFWGSYLWQNTNGMPSRQDYNNLATSIIRTYPELRGGTTTECGKVKRQLSNWVRNHRSTLKRQAAKRDHRGGGVSKSVVPASNVENESSSDSHTDVTKENYESY